MKCPDCSFPLVRTDRAMRCTRCGWTSRTKKPPKPAQEQERTIRPLRRQGPGFYHTDDGWRFQRDDLGYPPSDDAPGVRPGRRWFAFHESRDLQDTFDTLREAVAWAEGRTR